MADANDSGAWARDPLKAAMVVGWIAERGGREDRLTDTQADAVLGLAASLLSTMPMAGGKSVDYYRHLIESAVARSAVR